MICQDSLRSTHTGSVEQLELVAREGRWCCDQADIRSISLVGEADRKMLKAAIKQSEADQIRHRIIPADAVTAMGEKLDQLKDEIQEVLKEEREEKMVSL
jgi:hypothetical protein